MLSSLRPPICTPQLRRFLCSCKKFPPPPPPPPNTNHYHEAFARRMAMAGITPNHQIALGVSGGADSMALCVLAAGWKERNTAGRMEGSGFIDGLLGIVVDHRLRPESGDEARRVGERLSEMGIKCEIVSCNWLAGMPKQGHLETAARDMRYRIFQDTCIHHGVGVLLIAHHADDQAELFILRLSRNSGVLGLAGMAFVAQLFPKHLACSASNSGRHSVLLVRPMLEFFKTDMYKICEEEHQDWVEDPSNQSSLFARNRIRKSLKIFSGKFKEELLALISACRLTRSYVEHFCCNMVEQSVTIKDLGYAIIDLNKLDPSNIDDLCLSRFLTHILQFISQRHRQIRGSVLQSLLDYIRNIPSKNALTAGGCYLCPSPGSRGTQVVVCCSPDSPPSSKTRIYDTHVCTGDHNHLEINEIIMNAKLRLDFLPRRSEMRFIHAESSTSILEEAKKLNIISNDTYNGIRSLQMEEKELFNTKTDPKNDGPRCKSVSTDMPNVLERGRMCLFMDRFLVRWQLVGDVYGHELAKESCDSCMISPEMTVSVRCMVDTDWLHLADLSKMQMTNFCSNHMRLSTKRALEKLKSIPAAARRALPVLVYSQGLILCIPNIGFQRCARVLAESVFRPQVPLGGGFSSYV